MEPTFKELPQKIQLRPSDTAVYVSWQQVPCMSIYGKLIYTLIISNEKLNFTKQLSLQTDSSYKIDGLQSYTPYSLSIITARNAGNIHKGVYTNTVLLNFTTLPGGMLSYVFHVLIYACVDICAWWIWHPVAI